MDLTGYPLRRRNTKMGKRLTDQNRSRRTRRAFTLLELVVALVVLAVLVALAIPTYTTVIGNARTGVANSTALSVADDAIAIGALHESPATVAYMEDAVNETHGVSLVGTPLDTSGVLTASLAVTEGATVVSSCVQIPDVVNSPPALCGSSESSSTTTTAVTPGPILASHNIDPPLYGPVSDGTSLWSINFTMSGACDSPSDCTRSWSVSATNIITQAITTYHSSLFYEANSLTVDGTSVWITTNGGGTFGYGSVVKIDIATGAIGVVDTSAVDTAKGSPGSPCDSNCGAGIDSPLAITNDGTNVWVANSSGTECLVKININSGAVSEIDISTFCIPTGVASTGTSVYVLNSCGGPGGDGSVSQVNVSTGAVTEIDSASFINPYAITTNGTDVWVTNLTGGAGGQGSLSQIDVATDAVTEIDSSTFNNPIAAAVQGGTLWVANAGGGTNGSGSLAEVTIANDSTTELDSAQFNEVSGITADVNHVWVINYTGGTDGNGSLTEVTP